MKLEELTRAYGDTLRSLTHAEYCELVRQTDSRGQAAETAMAQAKLDPERRMRNILNYRVLRCLHRMETGEGNEVSRGELQLF